MPATRFPQRAEFAADRIIGFMDHLRMNGMPVGVSETECAIEAVMQVNTIDAGEVCMALKAVCAHDADRFERFDDLFKAYWANTGREQVRERTIEEVPRERSRWTNLTTDHEGEAADTVGQQDLPDDGDGEASHSGEGRLVASRTFNVDKADLREFMKPEDLQRACMVAERIAKAIRDRRSRRKARSHVRRTLDLRKIARHSVSRGGEPIELIWRNRIERPTKIAALLDVSGSMTVYARVFLAFLKGLLGADQKTDAYLFHTRLVRISDALRDKDPFRSVNRLSLMAQGFGGGTKIGSNLAAFNQQYASASVDGRTVVIILSDGYDTDPPEKIAAELQRLKRRGCKIIWLNPLKGWKGYEPVARGMSAALPHLDLFASATTLNDLAALEPHLEKI